VAHMDTDHHPFRETREGSHIPPNRKARNSSTQVRATAGKESIMRCDCSLEGIYAIIHVWLMTHSCRNEVTNGNKRLVTL